MSGICGIVNFDGAPVDPELLKRMAEAAAYRGPDGIHYWIQGNVGLAHLALHTTPESLREHQPLVNRRGDLVLTADARVDNRDELIRTLAAKGYLQEKDPTDADLILAAYECWGERCPEHFIGDFAFAIWDAQKQRLFAARDPVGYRGIYYRHEGGTFQWATEAVQLLADSTFPVRLNERMIARDLAMPGVSGRHESYYRGIAKLGPAERLIVDGDGAQLERYWDFDPGYQIRYASDDEYAEHFEALFRQAVRDRLRVVGPVSLYMSGGLDSTSVAAVAADELARSPGSLASGLHAITWTFELTPEANETQYSRAVAKQWGFEYQEWLLDTLWTVFDNPERILHQDEPYSSPWHSFYVAGFDSYINPQARVWMTGYDGDSLVGDANPYYYLHLIQSGRPISLIREFALHQQMYGISKGRLLRDFFLGPLVERPIKQRLQVLRSEKRILFPEWIPPDLAQRTSLAEWMIHQSKLQNAAARSGTLRWNDPAKGRRYQVLSDRRSQRQRIWYDRLAAPWRAEVWNPWDDIRLAEYIMAIPAEQTAQGINHKLILRHAMTGLLPPTVRERRGLRTGPEVFTRASLQQERTDAILGKLRSKSAEEKSSLLDRHGLKQAVTRACYEPSTLSMGLWLALSFAIWLRIFGSLE